MNNCFLVALIPISTTAAKVGKVFLSANFLPEKFALTIVFSRIMITFALRDDPHVRRTAARHGGAECMKIIV